MLSVREDSMDSVGGLQYAWLPLVTIPKGLYINNSARSNR
jgi:hypothetical protein